MFIFYNPHVDDLLCDLPYFKLRGRQTTNKYGFIIKGLEKDHLPLYVIIDHNVCSFLPHHIFEKLPFLLRFIISEIDYYLWRILNRKCNIVRLPRKSENYKNNNLIVFMWRNCESEILFPRSLETLQQFKSVILHCSHYFLNAGNKGRNVSKLKNKIYGGDNDFSQNDFFKNIFSFDKDDKFLTLPFAVENRFKFYKPLDERINKCIATGTIIDISAELNQSRHYDVYNFFKIDTYHVGRKFLHNNRKLLSRFDLFQSKFRSTAKKSNMINAKLKKFRNDQVNYFKIDLVDEYNKYLFAYVGEEITGATALGNFEAMASGCVMLGRKGFFDGIGLEPNVDFLEIDGDFDKFIKDFENGIINNVEISKIDLEKVSINGQKFVENNLREDTAYSLWIRKIEKI
jgi:hypothetical protein